MTTPPADRMDQVLKRFDMLEAQMAAGPDADKYVKLASEYSDIQELAARIKTLRALEKELNLNRAEVSALLAQAKSETEGATDLFPYTPLINQRCGREQKCAILTAMWRVAMADGNLDKYEDQLLRRVTNLLRLDHSDFIAAKQAARPKED